MGWPEVAKKMQKTGDPPWPPPPPSSLAIPGSVRRQLAVKLGRQDRPEVVLLHGWRV